MYIILIIILLIVAAWGISIGVEKQQCQSIGKRTVSLILLPIVTSQDVVRTTRPIKEAKLVHANVVFSMNYFKRIAAYFRSIFEGEILSYKAILERARQEAVLRLKENAPGADIIINVRIEAATIGRTPQGTISCIEMLAYGTAVSYKEPTHAPGQHQLHIKE